MSGATRPRLAHAAITVPDLDAALAWYAEALGLRPLPGRVESSVAERPRLRPVLDQIYDDSCESFRVAFLADGGSVALELFEFDRGRAWERPDRWPYERAGLSHVGFLVDDVDAAAEAIVAAGGTRRSRTLSAGGEGDWLFCFCEDPYGTVLELQSHGQEEMYGGG